MPIWLSFFHSWSFFVILGDHQCSSSFTFTGKQLHEHCTKCVPLCYTEYRKIYRFGETWGWVNDNRSLTTVGRWVKPPYLILISRAEPSKPNQPCLREKREKMSWSRMFRRLLHMWGAVYLSFWLAARPAGFPVLLPLHTYPAGREVSEVRCLNLHMFFLITALTRYHINKGKVVIKCCCVGLVGKCWKSHQATVFTFFWENDYTNGLLIVCCVCMVSKRDFTSRLCLWLRFSSIRLSLDCREDGDREKALFMFKAPLQSRHWIQ